MKIKIPFFSRNTNVVCTTKQVVDIEKKKSLDEMLEDKDNAIAAAMAAAVQPPRSGIFLNGKDMFEWCALIEYFNGDTPTTEEEALGEFGAYCWSFIREMRVFLLGDALYDSTNYMLEFPWKGMLLEWFINGGIDLLVSYKDEESFNLTIKTKDFEWPFIVNVETSTVDEVPSIFSSLDDVEIDDLPYNIYNLYNTFVTYVNCYWDDTNNSEQLQFFHTAAGQMLDLLKAIHDREQA